MAIEETIIFSRKVAYELRKMGFNILRAEPNYKHPQDDVYYFAKTDAFLRAMKEISDKSHASREAHIKLATAPAVSTDSEIE